MNHLDIVKGMNLVCPTAKYILRECQDGSTDITWLDQEIQQPSEATLTEAIADKAYVELRLKAYPPIGDQLDAIWKGGQDAEDMRAIVMEVKTRYPKP
jgi:hypothetical protein